MKEGGNSGYFVNLAMINIQEANSSHAQEIGKIAENTWWQAYSGILQGDQIRYMLKTLYAEAVIRQQLKERTQVYLLVFEADKEVGFASFAPREENSEIYKLHKLYVLPDFWKKGYGKLLIKEVERRVLEAGKGILELNVNRYNPAKKFYEKCGFSVAYEENIPIGEFWMEDYVMRKELKRAY